ncbi:MAG: penicillin acylase family protein [Pirellulales bacterium]|nr:penicillin acylase family protein [Pirellulales bacterium]
MSAMYCRRSLLAIALGLGAWFSGAKSVCGEDAATAIPGLSAEVSVYEDDFGIPHIYAANWTDAARVLGWIHARDRLFQMDLFRRQASGTLAEVLGSDRVGSDTLMRQLGIRRGCQAMWERGQLPEAFRVELEAYAAGVNARLATLSDSELGPYFAALGYRPANWSPVDSLVFSKYMGWDQSGTNDDLWFGMLLEKLGGDVLDELWPLDRPYERPSVTVQAARTAAEKKAAELRAAHADVRIAKVTTGVPSMPNNLAEAYAAAWLTLSNASSAGITQWRGLHFGSNNWAVDGTKTRSGKPMLCNDPHLGFSLPSIWYSCLLSVAGENVAGATFAGGPVVVIGHNDRVGWGVTNMQSDAVDYYVEEVDPADPTRYRHRGQWRAMERTTERVAVRGQAERELAIESTVHGPVISREGRTITLCWTGLQPSADSAAFWSLSHAKNLDEALVALERLQSPPLNMVLADVEGRIAMHPCGELPVRLPGAGRVPLDGASGDDDWTAMIPRDELPLAISPPEHFVASANNRPAPLGYPHYLGFMWDPSYRKRRIDDLLAAIQDLTVESMQAIQLDSYDKAAENFLPALLAALPKSSGNDLLLTRAAEELRGWDYVADVDAIAPVIWLRWLEEYRAGVWSDEWTRLGVEQPGGSWGYNGMNRREPMLEVLEYLTREFPQAAWFDDHNTPDRETRDDIARRSFAAAMAKLRTQFGDDLSKWRWGNINRLHIGSLSGQAELAREGGPVVGTAHTLNPGSNGGTVGSGASYRMIVDFGQPGRSVAVFPGGQSESPASPHYADQIGAWAAGTYAPLWAVAKPAELPEAIRGRRTQFRP